MRKNIYIAKRDEVTWQHAEALAWLLRVSTSSLVAIALANFLEHMEQRADVIRTYIQMTADKENGGSSNK